MGCSIDKELIEKTIAFHGHSCPGLAIGIRVSELALKKLGSPEDNDLIAIVETDMCGVDAIQFLTGCTFGKGNLIHKDYGKMAFNFYDRKRNTAFSAILRSDISGEIGSEIRSINKKVADGIASERELIRLEDLKKSLIERYMNMEIEEMFIIGEPRFPIPRPARILQSLRCEVCGEMTMESRTRRFGGKILCIPCFDKEEQKM